MNIRSKLHFLHPRALVYLATIAVIVLSIGVLRGFQREVSLSATMAVDGIGLALALIIGALALAYFRGFKVRSLLLVSMGCIGSGLIDLAHLVYVLTHGARIPTDSLYLLHYWSTAASHFYLAAMLLAGWRAAEGQVSAAPLKIGRGVKAAQIGVLGFLLISGLLTYFYLYPERIPDTQIPQLLPVISAMVYLGVLGIFLARGDWKRYPFQHWFSLALVLMAGSDICLAIALPPTEANLAFASDVLRVAAFGLVLAALILSTSNLLTQAGAIKAQRESNSDLQVFAHIVSHDLQEPLRMISSFLTLLRRRYADDLDDEAREFIGFAVEGSARMRDLLDGLLSYSRVQTGGSTFAETDLERPLRDALANVSMLLRESDASIDVGPLPVLPCDAAQMGQLFQNLLGNAIRFRRPEPLSIKISSRRKDGRWVVDVKDNGIGIDPANYQRIFQIFQRLNGREFPGTGVGLAVCNRIMERHGGHLEVTSTLGEGSTFSLHF